jgi:hypothetical protein
MESVLISYSTVTGEVTNLLDMTFSLNPLIYVFAGVTIGD